MGAAEGVVAEQRREAHRPPEVRRRRVAVPVDVETLHGDDAPLVAVVVAELLRRERVRAGAVAVVPLDGDGAAVAAIVEERRITPRQLLQEAVQPLELRARRSVTSHLRD